MSRRRSSLALLVGCIWALGLGGTAALAADMGLPVKAPPPPPPPPPQSWWSGFVEIDGESDLINPQGQNLIDHGAATFLAGLNVSLWRDKNAFFNNVTVGGLVATDWSNNFPGYWSNTPGGNSSNGALFDIAFLLEQSVGFGQYWKLSNTYGNVMSQDVADGSLHGVNTSAGQAGICNLTACSGFPTLVWDQVTLSFNDSFSGWWITFNPYVTFYYELRSIGINGAGNTAPGSVSAACFSCQTNNYDFFLGITPTIGSLQQWWGVPISLKAPTYVTVGPASFWNGNPNGLGVAGSGDVGTFTTGLTATWDWSKWFAPQYGHWYAKVGFQWYDVINTSLRNSNAVSICGVTIYNANGTSTGASCGTDKTNSIFVGFGGVGVAF